MEQKLLSAPALALAAPEHKQIAGATHTVRKNGSFEGYASLFAIRDLGNDMVMPGAFQRSLKLRGPAGVKMLWQHNAAEPVGVWTDLEENSKGLFVRGQLNLDVARAREIHSLMREGAIDGLSIGYRTIHARHDRKTGVRHLEQIDLWEISLVTFPMLPQARVSAVKRREKPLGGEDWSKDPAIAGVKRALRAATIILQ